jgi:hypothetical protein
MAAQLPKKIPFIHFLVHKNVFVSNSEAKFSVALYVSISAVALRLRVFHKHFFLLHLPASSFSSYVAVLSTHFSYIYFFFYLFPSSLNSRKWCASECVCVCGDGKISVRANKSFIISCHKLSFSSSLLVVPSLIFHLRFFEIQLDLMDFFRFEILCVDS